MRQVRDKQNEIYEFLKTYTDNKGYPPSVREICEAVGLKSTSSVHGHLKRLESKGLIKRDPTKPRALEIKDDSIKDKIEKTREYAEKYNKKDSKIKIYVSADAPHTCNPETITKCVELAKQLNTGLHIHLAETNAQEKKIKTRYGKRSTEYLNDLNVFDVPVVLAHGIYVSDSDIEILKNIRGGISHNPVSNCKLSSGICNVVKLRKNGINIGLGTDGIGSTSTMDMFEEMKTAAYLQKVNTMEPSSISAYDILKMATIEGAKVLGMEKEIGTIFCMVPGLLERIIIRFPTEIASDKSWVTNIAVFFSRLIIVAISSQTSNLV